MFLIKCQLQKDFAIQLMLKLLSEGVANGVTQILGDKYAKEKLQRAGALPYFREIKNFPQLRNNDSHCDLLAFF